MNAPDKFLTWRFEDEDEEEAEGKLVYTVDQKIPNAGTFVLKKEDHTLGNLLRIQLLRDNNVRFAGYRIPHPLIFECHLKIQTMNSNTSPPLVFNSALEDLLQETSRLKDQLLSGIQKFENESMNF